MTYYVTDIALPLSAAGQRVLVKSTATGLGVQQKAVVFAQSQSAAGQSHKLRAVALSRVALTCDAALAPSDLPSDLDPLDSISHKVQVLKDSVADQSFTALVHQVAASYGIEDEFSAATIASADSSEVAVTTVADDAPSAASSADQLDLTWMLLIVSLVSVVFTLLCVCLLSGNHNWINKTYITRDTASLQSVPAPPPVLEGNVSKERNNGTVKVAEMSKIAH